MTAQLMTLTSAVVLRGQRAWRYLKTSAPELRQMWRDVGGALNEGRAQVGYGPKFDLAFGVWCAENEFGDIPQKTRADAMWFAQTTPGMMSGVSADLTHPRAIREKLRAQAPAPSPDLTLEPSAPLPDLSAIHAQARKIHALANSAEAGDTTAKRHLDAKAKEFGTDAAEVTRLARASAPELTVPAAEQAVLMQSMANVYQIAEEMADYISRTQSNPNSPSLTREVAYVMLDRALKERGL